MLLSPHEIAWCVIDAGFSKTVDPSSGFSPAETMVAICLVESAAESMRGANTGILARSKTGSNIGNWDHGIAQISGKFHSAKIIAAGGHWRDPRVNLRIAKKIYDDAGQQFSPWATFNSLSYKPYLADARIAVAAPWEPPPDPWTLA